MGFHVDNPGRVKYVMRLDGHWSCQGPTIAAATGTTSWLLLRVCQTGNFYVVVQGTLFSTFIQWKSQRTIYLEAETIQCLLLFRGDGRQRTRLWPGLLAPKGSGSPRRTKIGRHVDRDGLGWFVFSAHLSWGVVEWYELIIGFLQRADKLCLKKEMFRM